ncbi:hypothetical protein LTR62_006367 [Meristemomyces frigidus]|uniref:Rad4-domain-containing protein n=1 Tax=Meristemomyces frigidus TaxID=1508187 RepID=A0AAN7TED1_9PEZI|nr:hypothetical protein LTR62_006367 [Meristemomyces frigidus]
MAPSRGKGKGPITPGPSKTAKAPLRATQSSRIANNATPTVFQDLLAEVTETDPDQFEDRPLKRRKVATPTKPTATLDKLSGKQAVPPDVANPGNNAHLQTIDASDDDDDESDFGFEDVDLGQSTAQDLPATEDEGIADLSISLGTSSTPRTQAKVKRRGASYADKAHRLLVHKSHVLCLLGHCIYANSWCNDETAHDNLKSVLSPKTKLYLRANFRESQFDRNRMFVEGLQQAVEAFKGAYRVTASGIHRASWLSEDDARKDDWDVEPMDRSDFIRASKRLEGSQDTGNQLFCALLRAVGVKARMVCSLQTLSIAPNSSKTTPIKPVKRRIYASDAASEADHTASDGSTDDLGVKSSRTIGKIPSARRRLGQPGFSVEATAPPQERPKPVRTLAYPVFWIEAFNAAHQKWIAVDPIVTTTVAKPSKFEPPSSYPLNQLTYVLAFESDGSARDVTRRYAKAYNAKTRRQRVESTENGSAWLRKALRIFRRPGAPLDRDQVEDAELAAKEAREGLPSNVLDFKDHPYYALERHLKRQEVIFPKREAGKVNAGTAAKPRMESVFRRQDVHLCRSGDKWFRLGREVRQGEQPLKRVVARRAQRARSASPADGDDVGEEKAMTPLYAAYQTNLYTPTPVVRGRVPRNGFGNLDVYVPSMVPAGGVHIRHPLTKQAAGILKVDAVDAVTGFKFTARKGVAVIEGAVVPEAFAEAVRAVIEGLEWDAEIERCRQRSLVALRLWVKFLKGLRIRERVKEYARADEGGGEEDGGGDDGVVSVVLPHMIEDLPLWTAGQYSIDELGATSRTPAKRKRVDVESDEDEGGFEGADSVVEEGMSKRRSTRSRRRSVEEDDDDEALDENDMLAGDENDGGGGFIVEAGVQSAEETESLFGDAADEPHDLGGGFMVEDVKPEYDDDGGGGGFMVEIQSEEHKSAPQPQNEDSGEGFVAENAGGEGGGFLVDDAEDEGDDHDMNGTVHAVKDTELQNTENEAPSLPVATPSTPTRNQQQAEVQLTRHPGPAPSTDHGADTMSHVPTASNDTRVENERKQREGTQDSLLSHDPEDEDAEPDWLESD